jgi:phosphoglycolate phosphatase-like HAD superfamily hydrolase
VDRLVLFDIDGTLIHTARAGVRSMNAAFRDLHGREDPLANVNFAGRTDRAIVADAFQNMGLPFTEDAHDAIRAAYLSRLAAELSRPVEGATVLPGVDAAIASCERHGHVGIGLLTGNYERGAAIKLGYFGLWPRFSFGAFGDRHTDRRDLVPVALESAARQFGARVAHSRVIVIGDTPFDVDCAKAHGAVSVAVATGPFSRDQLAEHNPDVLVDTLEGLDDVIDLGT